jgi:hypothetical protein
MEEKFKECPVLPAGQSDQHLALRDIIRAINYRTTKDVGRYNEAEFIERLGRIAEDGLRT